MPLFLLDHDDAVAVEQEQRHAGSEGQSSAGRGDRVVLDQLMAGEAARMRWRQVATGELLLQLLLARHNALAERLDVEAGLARLGEQAFRALLLFLDVVLDQLRQHRDLGVVELGVRRFCRAVSAIRTLAPSCSTYASSSTSSSSILSLQAG